MQHVNVIKQNVDGQETWRYAGEILWHSQKAILIEAYFNRPDHIFNGMQLNNGDRFVEVYFSERWYNLFEIHDVNSDVVKGWYCNVTRPACFLVGEISYVDLALDLLVFPDGRKMVLDEDEFDVLVLDEAARANARLALEDLQAIMENPPDFNLEKWVKGLSFS